MSHNGVSIKPKLIDRRSTGGNGARVSVLMPVYNVARYLRTAIDSMLGQTWQDFELVVVDDGSRDETPTILEEYAARDPRFVVLSRPNTGIVGALNDGLALARGEYVARMDGDDISDPTRLQKQVAFLDAHPDHELVGTHVLLIDPAGLPICGFVNEVTHEEIESGILACKWSLVGASSVFRRATMVDVGGYRDKYNTLEDMDLCLRMAERGRMANLPERLYLYRQHFGSTCFSRTKEQNAIREELLREAYGRRGKSIQAHSESFVAAARTPAEEEFRWAWMALYAGNLATARKYARRQVRHKPWAIDTWRLLYCAARGH